MSLKVLMVTNGALPVPAVNGGAMETLVEQICDVNESKNNLDLCILSIFNEKAHKKAELYKNAKFIFIKPNKFILFLDNLFYFVADKILNSKIKLRFKTLFKRLYYIYKTAVILKKNDFDKVVFENQMASLWAIKLFNNKKRYENKYYFHVHNHPERYAHCESIACDSSKIIAVSQFIGNAFVSKINLKDINKLSILKNCVDANLFNEAYVALDDITEYKKKYHLEGNKIILFTGRLIPGKGVKELIEAYKLIKTDYTKLVIVGSFNFNTDTASEYEVELANCISDDIKENVIFTGYIEHNQLPIIYKMADVVVLPSTCEDAAPLTVIETLTMHRPLITTTMGGISEYADSSCSILLENNDDLIINMAKAIDYLLDNDQIKKEFSSNAKIKTKDCNLENYYDNFVDILMEN